MISTVFAAKVSQDKHAQRTLYRNHVDKGQDALGCTMCI